MTENSIDTKNILMASSVGATTLIGSFGKYPRKSGNCFSIKAGDGRYYRIVNFYHENFEEMQRNGIELPVKILPIGDKHAIIHDERIPHDWYDDHWCEVCCPEHLLPITQRLKHDRMGSSGERIVNEHSIGYDWTKVPRFGPPYHHEPKKLKNIWKLEPPVDITSIQGIDIDSELTDRIDN